jgi:hypothetical protein
MCATADGSFAAQRRADSVLFLEAHKLLDADIFAAVWVRLSDSGFAFSKRHEERLFVATLLTGNN